MFKLSLTPRRWLLTLHVLFSAIMFGGAVIFLVLSVIVATSSDEGIVSACYTVMHLLARTSVRASTIGTLATGIMLSVMTQWGLFKYHWIIAKEALTAVCIVIGPVGMYFWTLKAVELTSAYGWSAGADSQYIVNSVQLWIGIIIQIVSLAAMTALSVFKPGGARKRRKTA
ncbi:hypothetical protein SK3146_00346 [Paenibacillus konkukensis]|uniref:DUF2269 domain-containing protein n=1 Tax=Paenibacillus konkukensis TaxID=2020716 RepID=A0ABY4RHE3_9BACL|nr:hypothetical protein [Paenibacillus konkukensis]UQZ81190.1 hypothetical protein SK3146_00346 [Paenibacillus konkukensis]